VVLLGYDTCTLAIFDASSDGSDRATILLTDLSCVDGLNSPSGNGFGDTTATVEVGQGWIEIYELGTVPADALSGLSPPDCSGMGGLVDLELGERAGRLAGESFLFAVPDGLSFTVEPVVLTDFGAPLGASPLDDDIPSLADAAPQARIDGLVTEWTRGIDAVSAVLAAVSLSTAFTVEEVIAARTQVVLTFPTRHHYAADEAPFTVNTAEDHEPAGQELFLRAFDRESEEQVETSSTTALKCSPQPPLPTARGPVVSQSQLGLHLSSADLDSSPLLPLEDSQAPFFIDGDSGICFFPNEFTALIESGQLFVDFDAFSLTAVDGATTVGLPVIPVSLSQIVNGTLTDDEGQNVLVNFQLTNPVTTTRRSESAGADPD